MCTLKVIDKWQIIIYLSLKYSIPIDMIEKNGLEKNINNNLLDLENRAPWQNVSI